MENIQKMDYRIGEKVKVMADPIVKITCPFCKGKGSIQLDEDTNFICQNCDEGIISQRKIDKRQKVVGVVTGFRLEGKTVESEDDEWWYGAEEGQIGVRQEYFVDVPEEYFGDGTYESDKIQKIEED